ncbi:MAG: CYTH domain-containing protein [Marinifilaceae bacterium]
MKIEIERKFLVNGNFKEFATKHTTLKQGYLSSVPERTVRIRIAGNQAYITIKGIGSSNGMSRFEWEKDIPVNEAEQLLQLCEPGIISKTRYIVPWQGKIIEVDEFHDDNSGLLLAEIELDSENEAITLPEWLGLEVTGDKRYYNSYLSKCPFANW